jgi:hypothetical protein
MSKPIYTVTWLLVAALPGVAGAADDTASDPRVERIRQDLGYYRNDRPDDSASKAELQTLREQMQQRLDQQEARIQRLERALQPTADRAEPAPVRTATARASAAAKVLTVCGQGCDFRDLQQAVVAVEPGGEINLAPESNSGCAVIDKPLRIVGRSDRNGHRAQLNGGVCQGKAALVTAAANIVIENLDIADIAVADGNGACVRLDKGTRDLTLRGINCRDSQDGLLGASAGVLLIEDSVFSGNGYADGRSHGLYISGGDEVVIRRSQILSTQHAGHSLKCGARKLTVEDSVIAALNGHNSRALDVYGGGEVVLRGNILQQGPASENSDMIGLALEPAREVAGVHRFTAENNWLISDRAGNNMLMHGRKLGPIVLSGNRMVGIGAIGIDGAEEAGNQRFSGREQAGLPPFDATPASLPAPDHHR